MSYVGMQNILKDRIIGAQYKPNGITEAYWNEICNKLGDEDIWDATVSNCVKMTCPDRVFTITSSLVAQYEAFRTIRNTCAHGKSGMVDYYHIECLWGFIQENFTKFVVNGGKSGIMQMVEKHYDRTITPPNTDCLYIIENIKLGISDAELDSFIDALYQFCDTKHGAYSSFFVDRNQTIALWDKLVNQSERRIHDAIIRFFMLSENSDIAQFISRYPSTADEFLSDSVFARKLWGEKVFTLSSIEEGTWVLLQKIVEKNLVPEDEKKEFEKKLYKFVGHYYPHNRMELLKKTDYFDRLRKYLFNSSMYSYPNGINFANGLYKVFVRYIHDFGLSEEAVVCINTIFGFASYGSFYDSIKNLMKNSACLERYKEIVTKKGYSDYSDKFESDEDA